MGTPNSAKKADPAAKNIENAVYSHIRAVRALGRTAIASDAIARALDLSHHAVIKALKDLAVKGVKIAE